MTKEKVKKNLIQLGDLFSNTELFKDIFEKAEQQNSWFTRANLEFAFTSWSEALSESNVEQWLSQYQLPQATSAKKVLIIMAGNLPLVGFHDLLCVLVAGHQAIVKLSSDDRVLLPYLLEKIKDFERQVGRHTFYIAFIKG